MKTAIELGFVPKYKQMTEEQTKNLVRVLCAEEEQINIPDEEIPFPIQIMKKRIEVMKLPIAFSTKGFFAALVLSNGNPGKVIIILIDCLTRYEGKTVTDEMICDLYPWGFYDDDSFMIYVDNYLKTKEVKWGNIY